MESENGITPDRSLKRTPKKEKAMTMLDLPLKKKQKQTHHNRSETLLTPPEGQSSGYATFKSISFFNEKFRPIFFYEFFRIWRSNRNSFRIINNRSETLLTPSVEQLSGYSI